jgi:hypothetical protein
MYQLIIDAGAGRDVSEHPDWPAAHSHLIDYVKTRDYYLELIQCGQPHTSYHLLDLGDIAEEQRCRAAARHPRTVGHAVIEELTHSPIADPPYYAAAAARRWIDDHHHLRAHSGHTDSGTRYPLAVLTAAQAEGRCWFSAGTLLREAAHLAGVNPIPHPDQALLQTLRRDAIIRATTTPTPGPAELAAAVQHAAPDDTPADHTAALIWWYALLTWGANAA